MAVTMEACWVELRAALTDAMWVVSTAASTAGYSVARLAGYLVASMDETTVGTMDASSVELKAASTVVK